MKKRINYKLLLVSLLSITNIYFAQSAIIQSEQEQSVTTTSQISSYKSFIDEVSGSTVKDLMQYALENNGGLQAARKMIEESRGRLRQAGLKANPTIEASNTQAVTSRDNNQMIGIELPLEPGGRRKARVTVAEHEVEIREAEVLDFERQLKAEVQQKYIEVITQAKSMKFSEELLILIQNSHKLIRSRLELGNSSQLELNLVWVELNKADAMRIEFEGKVEMAMYDLKKVIGMPPEEFLKLRGDFDTSQQPIPLYEALQLALKSRPDLLLLHASENIAAAQLQQARVEGKIDASIFANYQRMNFGYGIRGFNDAGALVPVTGTFHYATVGIRLTLPTRNKNQGLIEAATAAEEAARKRREFAEQVARNEITSAFARLKKTQSAESIYNGRVRKTAINNLEVLHKAYELGRNNLLDYIAEQRRFIEIETGYINLLKELQKALIEIERITGYPLTAGSK